MNSTHPHVTVAVLAGATFVGATLTEPALTAAVLAVAVLTSFSLNFGSYANHKPRKQELYSQQLC